MTRHATLTAALWTRDRHGDSDQLAEVRFDAPLLADGRLDLTGMTDAATAAVAHRMPGGNSQLSVHDGNVMLAKRTAYHGMASWTIEGAAMRPMGRLALKVAA